jgi:hypothetical protein
MPASASEMLGVRLARLQVLIESLEAECVQSAEPREMCLVLKRDSTNPASCSSRSSRRAGRRSLLHSVSIVLFDSLQTAVLFSHKIGGSVTSRI